MHTVVRALVGTTTTAALALTGIGVAQAAPPPTTAVQAAVTAASNEDVGQIVETIADIESSLNTVGLSAQDFTGIQVRDPAFLAELGRQLDARAAAQPDVPPATPGRKGLIPQRLTYAAVVARSNAAHDPDARDLGSETAYMYLSHYVDLQARVDPGTLSPGALSNRSDHYAAWITDDDRRVYDSFLRINRYTRMADDLRQAGFALAGLQGTGADALAETRRELSAVGTTIRSAAMMGQAWSDSTTLATAVPDFVGLFNDADDPAGLIDAVEDNLLSEFDQESAGVRRSLLLTAAFLAAGGAGGVFLPVALSVASLDAALVKDIADQAAITSLRYTFSGRLSGRMMRYYGW